MAIRLNYVSTDLEKLIYVVTYVIVRQCRIQNFEICTVHIFKYQAGSFRVLISNDIKELDNIGTPTKVLQYFDLSLYLNRMTNNKIRKSAHN